MKRSWICKGLPTSPDSVVSPNDRQNNEYPRPPKKQSPLLGIDYFQKGESTGDFLKRFLNEDKGFFKSRYLGTVANEEGP